MTFCKTQRTNVSLAKRIARFDGSSQNGWDGQYCAKGKRGKDMETGKKEGRKVKRQRVTFKQKHQQEQKQR